jgi:hypothetical protein
MSTADANNRSDGASVPDEATVTSESAEVERLRAEVERLRGRLDVRTQRRRRGFAVRRVIAAILVCVAGFGAVFSVIGLWGARTTLDTDHWVATVADLPRDPAVTAAMSSYLTDEVFTTLNVQKRLTEALPPKAGFLAAPVTSAVHDYMRNTTRKFMQSKQFQELWVSANRFAHAQILAVLDKRSDTVSVQGSTVTLNLLPVVNNLLVTIERELPTLFGKQLNLPTLTSGEIPAGLQQKVETALGVTLPDDFAQIKLYNRDRLSQLQQAVVTFKRSVGLLVAGTVLALALALWISPNRRRTILQLGLWLTVAVLVLSNVLKAVRDHVLGLVPEGTYRDGVSAAMREVFTRLRDWGDWILWIGVVVAVLAYLVGPGRLPVALRRFAVRGARTVVRTTRTFATSDELRTWSDRYVDVLRIGGVVVAAIVALLFSSWTALLIIAVVLIAYEVLVTLLAHWGAEAAPADSSAPEPPASASGEAGEPMAAAGVKTGQS